MAERVFDRIVPPDDRHLEKFPLRALPRRLPKHAPVVWGVNWYAAFDRPERHRDGRYWVASGGGDLGRLRGGHAIASPPDGADDSKAWRIFYDQGFEGACVGFSVCRAATWLNRSRYDARHVYREAQKIDYWAGEDYEGTSVRAGLEILRTAGPRRVVGSRVYAENPAHGIDSYWWAADVDEILSHFGSYAERVGAIPWKNSWGLDYPSTVWVPAEVAQRLIDEDGEIGVLVDR